MCNGPNSDYPTEGCANFAAAYIMSRFSCTAFVLFEVCERFSEISAVLAFHRLLVRCPEKFTHDFADYPPGAFQPLVTPYSFRALSRVFGISDPSLLGQEGEMERNAVLRIFGQTERCENYLAFLCKNNITTQKYASRVRARLKTGVPFSVFVDGLIIQARQTQQSRALQSTVDALSFGIALADENFKIKFMNACASRTLNQGLDANGSMSGSAAVYCSSERFLAVLLRSCSSAMGSDGTTVTIRKKLLKYPEELPFYLTKFAADDDTQGFYCIIFPDPSQRLDASSFLCGHGLTKSELILAGKIAAGHSLRSCSSEMGLSEMSARTYLKRVFSKLGVSRQSELVSIASRLSVPLDGGIGRKK